MSLFYPFGIPSTSSFAISSSQAESLIKPNYTAPYAAVAMAGPRGTPGANATTCPAGYTNALNPTPPFSPVPSNPNVDRSSYILCFPLPTPSVTPSITQTPSITPSITPSTTITPSITPSVTITASPGVTPTPPASITPTPSATRPVIALTITGTQAGGFPDFWRLRSNVAVPVDVIVASGNPEVKGYFGTTGTDLTNCQNGNPVEWGDTFPGATLLQGTTSIQVAGPGSYTDVTFRISSVASIDTNDGNGSQLRTTGDSWTDANNRRWSLTITDQTCGTGYPS